ncbi:MAG: hypothetical protein LH606_18220 [Cytophagaceae bacterium]|nr:hypothetical protein [Cytophagaceae bacterium]
MEGYPDCLLPQPHYRQIQFTNRQRNRFLAVFTELKESFDEEGRLKTSILPEPSERFHDFSTYLLGVFQSDDLEWQWLNPGVNFQYFAQQEWREGSSVSRPIIGRDVVRNSERGRFFWRLTDLNGVELRATDLDGDGKQLTFTGRVIHTPMNGNFWHCSVRWFLGELDSKQLPGKMFSRFMKSTARAFLRQNALRNEPTYQALDPEDYTITRVN